MKKKIVSILTCMMMCAVFLFSGFTSNAQTGVGADGLDFYVPYSKPEGDDVGYISVVLEKNSVFYLTTFFWIAEPLETFNNNTVAFNTNAVVYFSESNYNEIHIELSNISDNVQGLGAIYRYTDNTNKLNVCKSVDVLGVDDISEYVLDFSKYGFRAVGVEFGGNCIFTNGNDINNHIFVNPRIYWGGDNSVQLLDQITSLLGQGLVPMKLYLPKLSSMDLNLTEIKQLLEEMQESISDDEQQKIDKFEEDSGSQSNELDSLNQQTQVDKIDVDSASQTVDANLNIQTDSNFGLLLSAFTSNQRILTMLILVASVSLISYVLFGRGD